VTGPAVPLLLRGRTRESGAVCTIAILLALSLVSCGRKAPPRPPEDILPKTISDLKATNVPEGIQLSWSRPVMYADGTRMTDLAGFVIERAVGTEPRAVFQRVSTLEVRDRDRFRQIKHFQYVDRDTVPAMTYQYRVVSSTLDRYFSKPSNLVTVERTVPNEGSHALLPAP
jgi:hypothetical protein